MDNTTGLATKYLLDMLNIGVKNDAQVAEPEPSESQQEEQNGAKPTGESASVSSSTTTLMQTKTESEMSMSGILDGSTPRITLHPVNQTIHLGDNENGSSVFGNQVEIVTSQNTSSSTGTASNKIKFNQMVKYDWDLKYYRGNLIARGGQFIAYTLKGRAGYVVRLLSPETASRALIKGFIGLVTDLAFSHKDSNTLACVDEGGNVYVWKVAEEDDKITYSVKLHVKRSEVPISEYHRIFWCPYLPDNDEDDENEDDENEDDENRSLAVTHDNQAEVIDVAMVIARCNCNEVTLEMLQEGEGYVLIKDGHTKPITDGSLSPDNGVLATGSEDGYVKFWQVADMMPDASHSCLHEFQPHGGAPLSSLVFCDNHTSHEKDVPMWRFMITGAEYNREIKIWCTVEWICLQTLRFTSPSADIENVLGGSYFKMQLDITARYLVLSDIGRRVLYVLLVHQNRDEGQAHVSSITNFQLTQSLLSFIITKAKLFQLKSSDQLNKENGNDDVGESAYDDVESPDELDENELDSLEKRKNLMVQLKLLSIHTKSLQELLVHLQPEPSVAPPTPSIISSLNTSIGQGVRDALSDLSGVETETETSTDVEENDGAAPEPSPSPSVQPKLITPDAFTFSTKDQLRPGSNTSNISSGTLVSPLNTSRNSVEDSVTLSSVTSKLSESTSMSSTQAESPRNFFDKTAGMLTPTSLPLPGTPPFSSAPDPTTVPIPTFATSPVTPRSSDVLAQSSRSLPVDVLAQSSRSLPVDEDVQVENDKEQESEEQEEVSTPPASTDSEDQQVQSPASIKKDPFPAQEVSTSFEDEIPPLPSQEEDMDNTWMTATSEHTPPQLERIQKLQIHACLTSSPMSTVDIPPESPRPISQDLSSPLSELLQLVKAQQQQISTLRQEIRSYQTSHHQNITELVREEVEKLEDTLLERINEGLTQHSAQETQRLDKALKERQVTDKKKQEQLTSTLSQAVTNSISGKLDKTLKSEMKNNVIPMVHKVLSPIQEQLNTTMAQKLTAADAVLKESITKMVKNKAVVEAIGNASAVALQGPLQNTYREALQSSIIPGFERVCQSMFKQINSAFQKGTQQYLEQVSQTVEVQREQKEERDAGMEQVKSQLQVLQRNSSSVVRDVESVLQKQLATAMHSLREELTSRFESQIKLSIQNTMKAEVRDLLQDFRKSYTQGPVSETVPQQTVVDPKRRITDLIQGGSYALAFQEALTAADLNLVVFACESVDSNELFGSTPLPQPVLLSLIQQLSVDLLTNTELKHRYLTDAVMSLDPLNEVTREHMPAVLLGLCQQLTYAIADSQGPLQRSLKVLHMAAQSLIK